MNKSVLILILSILIFSCEKDDEKFLPIDTQEVETRAPQNKVDLCHNTGNGSWNMISVNQNAVAAHLEHGDIILDEDGDGFIKLSPCALFDCDDTDPNINPDAEEVIDGVDNDCDGVIDGGVVLTTYYLDSDEDGFGDPNNTKTASSVPDGYVDNHGDCDDSNPAINPNAEEVTDGIDNNCDGVIDGGIQHIYYLDNDQDSYGDPNSPIAAYVLPPGYVEDNTDCADSDALINPAADENCFDGKDNNCDGLVDSQDSEACPGQLNTYYLDYDQDGYGDPNSSIVDIVQPPGYVLDNTDCNDDDADINPGMIETCDNTDNDCNGLIGCDETDLCSCEIDCYTGSALPLYQFCSLSFPEIEGLYFTNSYGYAETTDIRDPNVTIRAIKFNQEFCNEGHEVQLLETIDPNTGTQFFIRYTNPAGEELSWVQNVSSSHSSCVAALYSVAVSSGIYSGNP